ncbi:MotA/TolQ/ExbB proton channel family protein [Oleiagrimonas citrea]|jgi:biopolymer transport protein ExbB|uniref:MotA/TolQ/ExbB proton channel family protein n=2 Tax=Rhodanobacteraceae TaxID=1775411 RepID=A0A846ZJ12_9GAMM|nr:MotA/TolQ/ExbB proton channel family protein [Oleiagrimonas citrea]NKZ37510.1 MotA/TolQ/ExbB proton channel family protein [Oleiagrimonas citrea]RAP58007.1 biopolymer transporter ExbB [Oleiagrimonas sp. MCCC 1A03011]
MAGGWGMVPILVCSAIALAIILERFWSLRRSTVMPSGLGDEVRKWAQSRSLDANHLRTLAENSPLGELLAAALTVRNRSREEIKERLEDTGRHVAHRMERFLNSLGTIALIAPLLGLLGTVIGLIRMFLAVMVSGVGDPMKMAGGIGEALICTASGLIVAIPAYILHRYFRGRVTGYCMDMEREASALLDSLSTQPPRPASNASRAAAPATAPRPARATR